MAGDLTLSFDRSVSAAQFRRLSEQTGWARGRVEADITFSLQNSFAVLGVWDADHLIGVARIISDGRFRALIDDVIIDEAYRGRGIGAQMMRQILERCSHIEEMKLGCGPEVAGFYAQFGFKPVDGQMARTNL